MAKKCVLKMTQQGNSLLSKDIYTMLNLESQCTMRFLFWDSLKDMKSKLKLLQLCSLTYLFFLPPHARLWNNCCHNFDLLEFLSLAQQDLNIISRSQNTINNSCYFLPAIKNYGRLSEVLYRSHQKIFSHSAEIQPHSNDWYIAKLRTV